MTVASEITRLQGAKADIRQAIIDRGVSVSADLTLDEYACCIASIPKGAKYFKYIAVGGGGGAGKLGGGGGGEVLLGQVLLDDSSINVVVGAGGCGHYTGQAYASNQDGQPTCITYDGITITARGGKAACSCWSYGGGASGTGCAGGSQSAYAEGGGGGGASTAGGNGVCRNKGGDGGCGLCGYGGGGAGGTPESGESLGNAYDGGGRGGNATNCGGGGGGLNNAKSTCCGGRGGGGLVEICYKRDGSSGISSATGGNCCYECDGYCVHRFTANGTFTIVS